MQAYYTRSWSGSEATPGTIRPRFYLDPVQDDLATAREGRPMFRQMERVEMFIPGNPWTQPVHNVTDEHRARWPREYEQFRQGIDQTADGTPLEEWPVLNRAQVLELKGLQIQTIEEVATLSDAACQRAMGLRQLRMKAKAFLDDAAAIALTEQLSAEGEAHRSEIASLKRQVEELQTLVNRLHAESMAARNAHNPIATTIPSVADPMQQILSAQQAGMEPRENANSSLGAFVEEKRRGPGRPRRTPIEDAA
jgi:hypothetical protein